MYRIMVGEFMDSSASFGPEFADATDAEFYAARHAGQFWWIAQMVNSGTGGGA